RAPPRTRPASAGAPWAWRRRGPGPARRSTARRRRPAGSDDLHRGMPRCAWEPREPCRSVQVQRGKLDLAALTARLEAGLGEQHAAGAGQEVELVVGAEHIGGEVLLPL